MTPLYDQLLALIHQFLIDPLAKLQDLGARAAQAVGFLLAGLLLGHLLRIVSLWLMRKLGISKLLDRFFEANINQRQYAMDVIVAKSFAIGVFLLFLRLAISAMGLTQLEEFSSSVIYYVPSLFIAVMIGFFGLRFSRTAYDMVYAGFKLYEDEQTSKVLAILAKGVVLAFTAMVILNVAKIVDEFVIRTVLVGFVATASLTFGLAFGLGGRDFARDIISRLKKRPADAPEPARDDQA